MRWKGREKASARVRAKDSFLEEILLLRIGGPRAKVMVKRSTVKRRAIVTTIKKTKAVRLGRLRPFSSFSRGRGAPFHGAIKGI